MGMMEIKRYAGLHPFFKAHRNVIQFKLIYKLKKKSYFASIMQPGSFPEVIVGEMWINLVDLSLQLGNTSMLIDHYRWTAHMLESRGVLREELQEGFSDVILTTKDIIIKMIQDEKQIAAWTYLFHALRDEFVMTVREAQEVHPLTEPVKLFGEE
jgi:hypothetical protein